MTIYTSISAPLQPLGTWCSGITSASHAEGPGFNPQCVHDQIAKQRLPNDHLVFGICQLQSAGENCKGRDAIEVLLRWYDLCRRTSRVECAGSPSISKVQRNRVRIVITGAGGRPGSPQGAIRFACCCLLQCSFVSVHDVLGLRGMSHLLAKPRPRPRAPAFWLGPEF